MFKYKLVHECAIHNSQKVEIMSKCPSTDEWINKIIHTIEYYSATKRNEVLIHATT